MIRCVPPGRDAPRGAIIVASAWLVIVVLSLTACTFRDTISTPVATDSEPEENACATIDCGGNGTCVVVRGEPDYAACLCNEGFSLRGFTACVASTSPCDGVDCGGHGACAATAAGATCVCNSGYRPEGASCVPLTTIPVQTLSVLQATPNTITWSWDATAVSDDVLGYVLWYGTDAQAVSERRAPARTWTANDDPNLAWGVSPYGCGVVQRTTITELAPDTAHFAHLWLYLADGRVALLGEASARTPALPSHRLVIFDEAMPAGWRLGYESSLAATAHSGSYALAAQGDGAWHNLTLDGMSYDVSGLTESELAGAFVELYVSISARGSRAWPVFLGDAELGDGDGRLFSYTDPSYFTLGNVLGWQRLQIPLASFMNDDAAMTRVSFGSTLTRFRFGFALEEGRTLYVDDIAIVY